MQLPGAESVCETFDLELTDEIIISKSVKWCGTEYKCGSFVVVSIVEDMPAFCKVIHGVCIKDQWYLQCIQCSTINFDHHFFAYKVQIAKPLIYKVVNFDSLIDHHPLDAHPSSDGSTLLIRMKYHVFKSL